MSIESRLDVAASQYDGYCVSLLPIVGSFVGARQCLIGLVQLAAAVVFAAKAAFKQPEKQATLRERSWTVLKMGVKNVALGALRVIPVIQTLVAVMLRRRFSRRYALEMQKFMQQSGERQHFEVR